MSTKNYIISTWDRSLVTTRPFYKTLRKVAEYYNAELILLPTNIEDKHLIPKELKFFNILSEDLTLNNNLVIKVLPVNALIQSPLSPWKGAFPNHSTILPGLRKELITETSPKLAKQLISPGAVGYISSSHPEGGRSSGALRERARHFIKPSALLVTIKDEDTFFTRHLTGNPNGVIYDLNKKFHYDFSSPEEHSPDMVQGDAHVAEIDLAALRANNEMLDELNIRQLFMNDVFSGVSVNRHEMHKGHKLALNGLSLREEAEMTIEFLKDQARRVQQVIYLHSNHDNFLDYYLDGDPKHWSFNGNKGLASQLYALRDQGKNPIEELLRLNEIENLLFWDEAKPYYSGQVSVAHGHCVEENTLIPMVDGSFKKIKDIKAGEKVWGYKNGQNVVTTVKNTIAYKYSGKMFKLGTRFLTQEVTEDHYYYTKGDKYIPFRDFIKDFKNSDIVRKALPIDSNLPDYPIEDNLLKLLVATCADGAFERGEGKSKKTVRFKFTKERKLQRLEELLNSLGYSCEWATNGKSSTSKTVYRTKNLSVELRETLHKLIPDKTLPTWFLNLSLRQKQLVIDELKYWDGAIKGDKLFTSMKREEIELVSQLLIHLGYTFSITGRGTIRILSNQEGGSRSRTILQGLQEGKKDIYSEVTDFPAACLETETQNFYHLTPRGHLELTGNCGVSGAKGNFRSLARAYNYYAQGHTHVPEVWTNAMCVGTLSKLDLGYNKGPSAWLHANGLIHPDGSMQLLPIIYGEWR